VSRRGLNLDNPTYNGGSERNQQPQLPVYDSILPAETPANGRTRDCEINYDVIHEETNDTNNETNNYDMICEEPQDDDDVGCNDYDEVDLGEESPPASPQAQRAPAKPKPAKPKPMKRRASATAYAVSAVKSKPAPPPKKTGLNFEGRANSVDEAKLKAIKGKRSKPVLKPKPRSVKGSVATKEPATSKTTQSLEYSQLDPKTSYAALEPHIAIGGEADPKPMKDEYSHLSH